MTLSLVGLGLGDARDITLRGLDLVKAADVVYLECYTAVLSDATTLAETLGKEVIVADREAVESGDVLTECDAAHGGKNVALLVVGDPFGATTHTDLVVRCREQGYNVEVAHNASILNAVGCCGLQLYRFGQTLSMCFWTETWRPTSWFPRLVANRKEGVHTLLLLDIKVKEISDENLARGRKIYEPPRFMTIAQGAEQVLAVEAAEKTGAVTPDTVCCGVARVGFKDQVVAYAKLKDIGKVDFGGPLHSLVVCGDIHECETDFALGLVANLPAGGEEGAALAPAVTKADMLVNACPAAVAAMPYTPPKPDDDE